jgi:peptidyl-prolyl cis-trans isomerase SurA
MKKIILLLLILSSTVTHSRLLDKIAGVINDKVYTLSEIERINSSLSARKEISPFIYTNANYTNLEILKLLQRGYIIKDKLSSMGFVISDDSVESRIVDTEKRLGLSRRDLLDFLKSKNINFNEYFEIIRETMEFNVFNQRIIAPLVSITDQELKNFYYKLNTNNNKVLAFKYTVVDFYLNENQVIKNELERLPDILSNYQKTGNIPSIYKDIQTNNLGTITGEDVPSELNKLLHQTSEGSFSKPYVKGGVVHIFYVKSKDLTESSDFLNKKELIYNQIFAEKSKSIFKSWFLKESTNYYIQENI